ncbi:M14 family metallopeptidase [Hymenobacter psychrophilus]|uniref:Zinc carboxypeptidase n=1 Tax=Hymenobacter psychrophilus TaxID=651662 RepID=A0A1H3FQ17_9BACT|nr:M14 family metallopeptidase [Hymenobacter psychrophilus]SDX93096.1 Zinc carboxypeptidase [Hymenobacter psychrophilus]
MKNLPLRALSLLLLGLLTCFGTLAQTPVPAAYPNPLAGPADGPLLTPAQFLGYELGARFTPHAELLRYMAHVAAHSPDRMKLERYGSTYENRPLELVYIASAANLARLDDIRRNNLRLASLEPGTVSGPTPAVVWLSYNVHGNEAVSSEAVMQVLHDLANPANTTAQGYLQNLVVIVDPCVNPDGRDRYAQWYNRVASQQPNASPLSWEHREPWPGGRYNHYYFDLNRDWAWQTQQESRQRIAVYNQWLPQVHADFHEMGPNNPYYFSPAAKPFHADLTAWQRQFQDIIGDYNRRVFDKNNWLYFTRETYDLFAPFYGDTWPSFNGAIGVTYEQGGGGVAGIAYAKTDGDTLTLSQRIEHHHATSLATLQAAAERHQDLTREFRKFYDDARTRPKGEYKSYVLAGSSDPGQVRALTQYLDRQQIAYGFAAKRTRQAGYNYATGRTETVQIEAQDVVISMYQPKSTLVKVLFEPQAQLEDSLTYDLTAWSLPYAFGLNGYALKGQLPVVGRQVPVSSVTISKSTSTTNDAPYAYLARWNNLQDVRFLSRLLQQGVKLRVAEEPFETEGQKYGRGTLIIARTGNERLGARFDQLVRAQADSAGVLVQAVQSGLSTTGGDLGSRSVRPLAAPNVAVLAGPGIDATAFGEVWHFFEQQVGYPVTVLGTDYFGSVPLSKFDVLILPDGRYDDILTEKTMAAVKTWVRGGGRLIALEGASRFLAGQKDILLKSKPTDSTATAKKAPYAALRRYADAEREGLGGRVQGSVFRVQLDNTHPLAFGYGSTYFALLREAPNYTFLPEGGWNVGVLKKDSYAAGFAGRKTRLGLTDSFVLGTQDLGRGQIVYLADNPLFRAFWQGGKLLFGNAVFIL